MADTPSADNLIDALHTVIRDAESLLKATAAQTGEKIEEARAHAEESVRLAKARLAGIEDEALERARELAKNADHWTPIEQMWVAERAYRSGRGFYPWPNTARYCG